MNKLCETSLPYQLYLRLIRGEYKTIKEWAIDFHTTYFHIATALCSLRKREMGEFHPIREKILVNRVLRTNMVVDIEKKKGWFVEGMNTYEDSNSIPRLESSLRMAERGYEKFPVEFLRIQASLDKKSRMLLDSNERIRDKQILLLSAPKKNKKNGRE